jgi:hypothetical protein
MKELLEKLTKEDLIKVVANMHDTIQEWNNGYGLPSEEAETLIKIGSACTSVCSETQDWSLPQV